jgi:lipopolysaccharide transport system permease protein
VLVAGVVVIRRELHASILWLPVLVLPQLVLMLGAAWLVSSLGVFLRDTGQVVGLLLVAWMFLTPIIYPEQIVPARYQSFINANPFTPLVRNYRRVILEGASPDWTGLAYFTLFAIAVFVCGYWWFARTRKNFADVI